MNLTQIQAGDYSSLLGTWIEVAYAVNAHDGNGFQWKTGALIPDADILSVSSDKIVYYNVVIQGNSLTDSAGSHLLEFDNSGGWLDAWITDADVVAINWGITFYPRGVTNDIDPNNGVVINNTSNLILIWTSSGFIAVFAQAN
jgi:hypothetical protein